MVDTKFFNIPQNPFEYLRKYLTRFNEVTINVVYPNQEMFIGAFKNGLKVGHFN